MFRVLFLLGTLLLVADASVAAPFPVEWHQTYGGSTGDFPASVRQTADGGYALAGNTSNAFRLIKTDSQGSVQWDRSYPIAGRRLLLNDMELTHDGGYVLAGHVRTGSLQPDFFLLKADLDGDEVWSHAYGDSMLYEFGIAVSPTSDGGYIVVGNASFPSPRYDDLFLVKTDASGSVQWTQAHDAGDLELPHDVLQTADGGYVLGGYTTAFGAGTYDFYLAKTNAGGLVEWERASGGINRDWARALQQTSDGGFILAGWSESFGGGPRGDAYLVKTTANGTQMWARTYGGLDREEAVAVQEMASGGYLMVGLKTIQLTPNLSTNDVFVALTTATGDSVWTQAFGGDNRQEGVDVVMTSDGGAAILALASSASSDFWLVKTGPLSGPPSAVTEWPLQPVGVSLLAYPNPFNPSTRLIFKGAEPTRVRLTVHDAAGRLVRTLTDGARPSGEMIWTLHATGLASGIYTAVVETDRGSARRKLVVFK